METKKEENDLQPVLNSTDWLLETLIEMVNSAPGTKFGITLNVGGLTISGYLVGGEEYMHCFVDDFASAMNNAKNAEAIKEGFQPFIDMYTERQEKKASGDHVPPPAFIHLEIAKLHPFGY